MQPELYNASQNDSSEEVAPKTASTSQYGFRNLDQPASQHPHSEEQGLPHTRAAGHNPLSHSPERVGGDDKAARLSPASSPRNRVEEYENAVTQSTKKGSEDSIFEVIKKARSSGDQSSPIAKLPNGTSHPHHLSCWK